MGRANLTFFAIIILITGASVILIQWRADPLGYPVSPCFQWSAIPRIPSNVGVYLPAPCPPQSNPALTLFGTRDSLPQATSQGPKCSLTHLARKEKRGGSPGASLKRTRPAPRAVMVPAAIPVNSVRGGQSPLYITTAESRHRRQRRSLQVSI